MYVNNHADRALEYFAIAVRELCEIDKANNNKNKNHLY